MRLHRLSPCRRRRRTCRRFEDHMSKSDTFEADILKLIFNATAIANLADNAAASPLTNISVALHTADPGETGNMTTSEATYTGYTRVSVARTSGGWTISGTAPTQASP